MSINIADKSSAEVKAAIIKEVQEMNAINQARTLISRVNKNCFERCVPKPGSSLSSKENACVSACAEKYLKAFNVVGQEVVKHMQATGGMRTAGLI